MTQSVKLDLIRKVNALKTERKKEIGITVDGLFRQLIANPSASYSHRDIQRILEEAKEGMHGLNERTFGAITKTLLPLVGDRTGGTGGAGGAGEDPDTLDQLRAQIQERDERITFLNFQLKECEDSKTEEDLSALVYQLNNDLRQVKDTLSSTEIQFRQTQDELDRVVRSQVDGDVVEKYKQENQDLRSQVTALVAERGALEGSVRRMEATVKNNQLEVEELEENLQEKNQEIQTLVQTQEYLESKNNELQEAVIRAGHKIKTLDGQTQEMQQQVAELQKELGERPSQEAYTEVQAQVSDLQRELSQVKEQKELLLIDGQEAKDTAQFYKSQSEQHQARVQELLRSQRSQLQDEISQHQKTEHELQIRLGELESQLDTLRGELDLKKRQNETHQSRQKELNNLVSTLRAEVEELTNHSQESDASLVAREEEVRQLGQKVSQLEGEVLLLKNQLGEQEESLRAKQEELDSSLAEQLVLEEKLQHCERDASHYQERSKKLLDRERKVNTVFKRELERIPKYIILFVLNEVRRATMAELQRTLRRPALWVRREVQSLEQEGFVQMIDDDTVEMIQDFPPVD